MDMINAMSMYDVTDRDDLEMLYDNDAVTYDGLSLESVEAIVSYIIENTDIQSVDVFVTMGSVMNEICKLEGDNSYPEGLHIVSFMPTGILPPSAIGARTMKEIIDKNAILEAYHPFDELYFNELDEEGLLEARRGIEVIRQEENPYGKEVWVQQGEITAILMLDDENNLVDLDSASEIDVTPRRLYALARKYLKSIE